MADLEKQAREILRAHRGDGTGCYGLYSEDQAVAAMLALRAAQPVDGTLPADLYPPLAPGPVDRAIEMLLGWRKENPLYDGEDARAEHYRDRLGTIDAALAALTTSPAGRPEDLPTAERHQDTLPIVGSHQDAPAGRPEKEARPDREGVAVEDATAFLADFCARNGGCAGRGMAEDLRKGRIIMAFPSAIAVQAIGAALATLPTDDGSREERMREALGRIASNGFGHPLRAFHRSATRKCSR